MTESPAEYITRLKQQLNELKVFDSVRQEVLKEYKKALEEIKDYCEKCKKCAETGDEVILYTVIKKVNEVLK